MMCWNTGKTDVKKSSLRSIPQNSGQVTQESFYRLFESVSEGMALVDEGYIVAVNATGASLLGYEPQALIGVEAVALVTPPFREIVLENNARDDERQTEVDLIRMDGSTVPVQLIGRSIPFAGKTMRLITTQDISARRQVEAALRASEARFRALVQYASEVMLIRDIDGTIRYLSPAAERVFGYPMAEMIGRNQLEFIHPEDYKQLRGAIQQIHETPGVHPPLEYRVRHKDDTWRYVECIATNLVDDPDVQGIIVNVHDITERKVAQQEREDLLQTEQAARHEAEAAVKARDEFLSIAAHELKSPLTVMNGSAEMLARHLARPHPDSQRIDQLVQRVQTQIAHFGEMVNDLLDLTRLRYGQLSLQKQDVDLVAVTNRVIERFTIAVVANDRHTITLDAPPVLSAIVDETRIEQVLTNLLENAIKYSPDGGAIQVELRTEGNLVVLRVRDQGIGITPAERGQIFNQFTRTTAATAVANGLGIGLYVTAQIVAGHGGVIDVISEPGQGSTFTVRLPRNGQP